ncbi:MAG: hypothetical protein GY731_02350 [Gammaproteobacteria bacterium]|nr:hypothetical protein [Gammaproteobacteria bacterium]
MSHTARDIHLRFGPIIDYPALLRILDDRKCARYPVTIVFNSARLEAGFFAIAEPATREEPANGYEIVVHEHFRDRQEVLPALILYHLVSVNYGDIATWEDAEVFGSTVLGMDREEYYSLICELADSL